MKQGFELTGQNVEGYKISKPIGQGKFSIVYKAQNQQGVTFALKKLKIFDMADQKQRQKCLKQVDLMKQLNHPNIIQYIDSFIHNNELIIVTQWADKGDLKKLIRDHEEDQISFDQPAIWRYMKQTSGALMHMHEKRIMHRDLKPANIFISHDYTLKIGDLGLGRSFSSQTLEAYSKVGTPLYMSPQLIQDSGYNQNADVWSLGCIIYELCELNSPFRNKKEKMSLMDLFDNITKCNYKPISSKYTPQLSQAIRHMIVVDPSKRWSSEQVFRLAQKMLDDASKPRFDPFITMDDIHIKLNLLNYFQYFCKVAQKKPINKFYFALQDYQSSGNQQLFYFLQMCYWIMSLSKQNQKKDKLALYSKTLIDWQSNQSACTKFFTDLNNYGIKTDEISSKNIIEGYGQHVCFLLNQVLNRELIRSNFQFLKPIQNSSRNQQDKTQNQSFQDTSSHHISDGQPEQTDFRPEEIQFEEQSEFQQSIFFNKNQRKQKNIAGQLLEKIQQFDNQNQKMVIYSKIDEIQWKLECERLGKTFNEITQKAKQLRKKNGYQHFQTAKICTAKITDLINYVKPASNVLLKGIESNLQIIRKGEDQINNKYKSFGEEHRGINDQFNQFSSRQSSLGGSIKQRLEQLQNTVSKIQELESKIKDASEQSENQSTKGLLKKGIQLLRKQIVEMQQKKGIMIWELTKMKTKAARNEDKAYLDSLKNQIDMQAY